MMVIENLDEGFVAHNNVATRKPIQDENNVPKMFAWDCGVLIFRDIVADVFDIFNPSIVIQVTLFLIKMSSASRASSRKNPHCSCLAFQDS